MISCSKSSGEYRATAALAVQNLARLEVFVSVYMLCRPSEHKSRMWASPAWREFFSVYASYLVLLSMDWIVNNLVNTRVWNVVSRFKNISNASHCFFSFAGEAH
jgi:hypothetical protein